MLHPEVRVSRVRLTLRLAEGHAIPLVLDEDDPGLDQVMRALAGRAHPMDDASAHLRGRRLSVVLYLHRHPRPFAGGGLVVFDHAGDPAERRRAEGFRTFEPADNRLVAFPSLAFHQVRAVRCPGGAWADGRFTVNGWVWEEAP
jgi:hypothetical protein